MVNLLQKISDFEKANKKYAIAYGGDGTLLVKMRKTNFSKVYVPIRNYGQCQAHLDTIGRVLEEGAKFIETLPLSMHKPVIVDFSGVGTNEFGLQYGFIAMSEITIKSQDPTSALRFDVRIDGNPYLMNCMADGLIYATDMGSHGYWKSATRTLFRGIDTVGLGFIAPTYGVNNLVLDGSECITVVVKRESNIVITADKYVKFHHVNEGDMFYLKRSNNQVAMRGYGDFCCYECRKNRNSTQLNDMYFA